MKKTILLMLLSLMAGCFTLPTSTECFLRADGYFKDGKAAQALKYYNRAIELNPDNLEAYASRGSVHFFQGHYDLAEADFVHVLKVNPYQADAYTAYASTLAAKGDYRNALEILNLAIRLNQRKPEIFFSRAGVNFMLGRYQEAIIDYTSVLNLYPAGDVYNARGAVYLKMGENEITVIADTTAQPVNEAAAEHHGKSKGTKEIAQ
jgi:tetratricopeptide (TPR) repeat protein